MLPKLIKNFGIINVGGKSQYIFDFVKKYNKKIKKNYLKKTKNFPKDSSINSSKLKSLIKIK